MISLADATDYVQFAATGKNRFLERGTKVRWPWWSVRKASKMRSDHLEVLVSSQQGEAIFATGARVIGALRDFGVHPERWTVSVKNAISVVRPNLGLWTHPLLLCSPPTVSLRPKSQSREISDRG